MASAWDEFFVQQQQHPDPPEPPRPGPAPKAQLPKKPQPVKRVNQEMLKSPDFDDIFIGLDSESMEEQQRKDKRPITIWEVLSSLFLTVGVLLSGFIAWLYGWTEYESSEVVKDTVAEFYHGAPDVPADAPEPEHRTDDPPDFVDVPFGATMGVLHVLPWDSEVSVIAGSTQDILNAGHAGHYENTVTPGGVGNFSVAAHRTTYGSAFKDVAGLEIGDYAVVETPEAYLLYKVANKDIVDPHQIEAIAPVPFHPDKEASGRYMTFTTCHPLYGRAERYIVNFELEYWTDRSEGVPGVLR